MEEHRHHIHRTQAMGSLVALLRGINVGGHNKIAMAELRSVCTKLGWTDVQTYIQSGNVILRSGDRAALLESTLEAAIQRRFGLAIPVIVRTEAEWEGYVVSNPFPEVSESEPNRLMLALSKARPNDSAAADVRARAVNMEQVVQSADALWLHFPRGAGTSKITPALLDRAVGSTVTMRNWRTVLQIRDLFREANKR